VKEFYFVPKELEGPTVIVLLLESSIKMAQKTDKEIANIKNGL
jgi:hypothetical protein